MDPILNIETSTSVCSVSVSDKDAILAYRESKIDRSHASVLTVFVGEAMAEAGIEYRELSAVAVSRGPGSYTGLRIGVSAAKGICYGADIPLIALDTLMIMAHGIIRKRKANDKLILLRSGNHDDLPQTDDADDLPTSVDNDGVLLCPMIDARRMEVYTALYDTGGNRVKDITAEIINNDSFKDYLDERKILFFGDGSGKCRDMLKHPNAIFIEGIYPSACFMGQLSFKAFAEKKFEDTAYFEPFYLKDFLATTPKNKMI